MSDIFLFQPESNPTTIRLSPAGEPRYSGGGFWSAPSCCCRGTPKPPGDPIFCCAGFPLETIIVEMTGWGDLVRTGYPTVTVFSDVRLDMRLLNGTHVLSSLSSPTASCTWVKDFTTTVYIRNRTFPFSERTVSVPFTLSVRDNFGAALTGEGFGTTSRVLLLDVYQSFQIWQGINNPFGIGDQWSLATDDETAFDFQAYRLGIPNDFRCTFHNQVQLTTINFSRYKNPGGFQPYTPTDIPTFRITAGS